MGLTEVKGIGSARQKQLNRLGIESVRDLIMTFPTRYVCFDRIDAVCSDAVGQEVLLSVRLARPARMAKSKQGRRYVSAEGLCGGKRLRLAWFNADYVAERMQEPGDYLMYGVLRHESFGYSMVNPTVEPQDGAEKLKGICPIYTLRNMMPQGSFRLLVQSAIKSFPPQSVLPEEKEQALGLMPIREAVRSLHQPSDLLTAKRARERVRLERMLSYFLSCRVSSFLSRSAREISYEGVEKSVREFVEQLPYTLTNGQNEAIADVIRDLKSAYPMNRLVEGDVGSGKTVVMLAAVYAAVKSGFQAAVLAPTEVLARQHEATAAKLLPDIPTVFLSGSLAARERKEALRKISSGEAKLVVGTHALFSPDVEYRNLQFVAVDEQHRFGVAERTAIGKKGAKTDMLVMSATPIPRTLSLALFGKMNVSRITDKPKGRMPVTTYLVKKRLSDMFGFIRERAREGLSSYIVCPLIEENEELPILSVTALYNQLKEGVFSDISVEMLHGGMTAEEKQAVLNSFSSGKTRVLISTTVIEVGVDVPHACVMAIMHAERFGLAALHQLRGRVGRGNREGYCFLCTETDNPEALKRLQVLKSCSDGFEIAEQDYKNRGGGDLVGYRQSGESALCELLQDPMADEALTVAKDIVVDEDYAAYFAKVSASRYVRLSNIVMN
ncbi:MAG: ATP-dependent DNA helicase RecG [Clostridia bacterium]|nr:ATP-dependent DNA helicase RecG [Clostridia bacterium]